MRKLYFFVLAAAMSLSATAQQSKQPEQKAAEKAPIPEERIRADGAAGGTKPLPEEKRRAVGAGAGPHLRDHQPSPAKLPRDEPVVPPK